MAVLVAAIVTLAVALFVLVLDFQERVHRAFALFLVLRAMLDGFLFFAHETDPPAYLRVYWLIAVPFAALHFCLAYRRRHGRRPEKKAAWGTPLAILGLALAAETAYFLDHALFGLPPAPPGPLSAFAFLRFPAYAAVALLFAVEFQNTRSGAGRKALLLAGFGMALAPLFACSFEIAVDLRRMALGSPFRMESEPLYYLLGLALVADACRRFLAGSSRPLRWKLAWILGAVLVTSAATFWVFVAAGGRAAEQVLRGFLAMWALAVPLCVTYALVRYRLFDAEVKLRFAIKGTTVAAVFVATFLVVGKLTEKWAEMVFGRENWIIGAVAAGLMLFALTPLQNLADRIARRAVPGSGASRGSHADRLQIYREQLEIAWADGRLTPKERLLFARLQERLGIEAAEATRLETEVLTTMGAKAPRGTKAAPA